ncbi:OmpA family protein [Psychrobacter sp. GW64-MNA-CIBAN-0177]|jgi:OOP family OmpA-OmpF porin|uniref:OmpA family protein n=1 Tax=Psychrobacter sp. GW64-MNA-CIBAN-0177 TaxID=3140449 RepID=UPI00332B8A7B
MKAKLRLTIATIISALTLSACQTSNQTPDLSKQKSQTINMPTVMVSLDSDGDGVPDELDQCPNTPENVVIDGRGCPFTTIGTGLQMEYRAFFAKGSSELTSKYQVELDKVAARMKEYDTAIFKIEAHISEDEINKELSSLPKNRALIIKNYLLLKHGIESSRLMTLNCDARAPIAPNDTDEGRSFNRRVYALLTEPDNEYPINLKDGICVKF